MDHQKGKQGRGSLMSKMSLRRSLKIDRMHPHEALLALLLFAADGDFRIAFERFTSEHQLENHMYYVFLHQSLEIFSQGSPTALEDEIERLLLACAAEPGGLATQHRKPG